LEGAGFERSPILRVPFYLCVHPFSHRTTKLDVVTHVGEGRVSWGHPRRPSQENGVPAIPNYGGSPVLMPTPFNAERPNSACNTCEEGRVLGQQRHCTCTNASRGLSATAELFVDTWNDTTNVLD